MKLLLDTHIWLWYLLGNPKLSIDFHQQSIEIKCEISDRNGEANSLGNLGNAYQSLGQYQRAIDFYQQSLEIEREIGKKRGEASLLFCLSNIYQQRGRLKLSMHYRHQAYRIWQDMSLPLAASPLPEFTRKLAANIGDNWAEQLIASEKTRALHSPNRRCVKLSVGWSEIPNYPNGIF